MRSALGNQKASIWNTSSFVDERMNAVDENRKSSESEVAFECSEQLRKFYYLTYKMTSVSKRNIHRLAEPNRSFLATDRAEPALPHCRPNRTDRSLLPIEPNRLSAHSNRNRTEPKVNRRSGSVRFGLQLSSLEVSQ